MKLTSKHQLTPTTTWDPNTDSYFPVIKITHPQEECYHRVIRYPYSVRKDAQKVADEFSADAMLHGELLV